MPIQIELPNRDLPGVSSVIDVSGHVVRPDNPTSGRVEVYVDFAVLVNGQWQYLFREYAWDGYGQYFSWRVQRAVFTAGRLRLVAVAKFDLIGVSEEHSVEIANPGWAVILCNPTDVPPGPNARNRYDQYFTRAGAGAGGAFDYWRDVSYDMGSHLGTEVYGFFDIGQTRAQVNSFSGTAQRRQIFNWGLAAAVANNVDLSRFARKIVVLNISADHGGEERGGVVLAFEDTRPLELSFISHEMGHGFGLDHSFGEQSNSCAFGDARPGAYCDTFDIMSAFGANLRFFLDAQGHAAGPSLNAFSRVQLGWIDGSRIWMRRSPGTLETVKLAALNRLEVNGFLMASFRAPSRKQPQILSTYTVELREAKGWDRGIGSTSVLIHEVSDADKLVRLLTDANGGVLTVGQVFTTPVPCTFVRLDAIDEHAATASLTIWSD